MLVFEHADCVYCRVFRRDVLPQYHQAVRANTAPLRFVDIAKDDTDSLGLNSRIDTLPTAVVMRNGREVDRIVCVITPPRFLAVGAWYEDFGPVSDDEVRRLLESGS